MVFKKVLSADVNFMDSLKDRLRLREVNSVDESDVIIAFVPITSRAGTDIESALKQIPQNLSRPVVLVVLHHTSDSEFVTPDSSLIVSRENVFTVDCLFHEDKGLLRCLCNDKALKAVTDHLNSPEIFKRTSDQAEVGVKSIFLDEDIRGGRYGSKIISRYFMVFSR
ncbi:hypothetical protein AMEX_G26223 [Astyanax mexicanus]|uniref:Uncharacterized protein n=1 Tax=Astyanax mexicanus TaxID=7994 RepID=A0A8T2KNJ1_ASTMX|nr:hypothetical protein AMEX_G26223 [Astyanax mexicanus]